MQSFNRRWRALRVLLAAVLAVSAAAAVPATALAQGSITGGGAQARAARAGAGGSGQDLAAVAENGKSKAQDILTAVGVVLGGAAILFGLFVERSPKIALVAILGTILAAWAVNGGLWDSGKATADGLSSGAAAAGRP